MRLEPRMIRRHTVAAMEGAMQCPRCSYVLSSSDALICRVGDAHYCPRCWSRIPDVDALVGHPKSGPQGRLSDDPDHDLTRRDEEKPR